MTKSQGANASTSLSSSSPFNLLPDEILIQVLNKLIDLKTLCRCKLVSKRFNSTVLYVDAISFTASIFEVTPNGNVNNECNSLDSAIKSIMKFTYLKSLCIQLPSSENTLLYKWKVKFSINKLDSFLVLSPNSISCNANTHTNRQEVKRYHKFSRLFKFQFDAIERYKMLSDFILDLPLLEKVSITDSGKQGTISFSGKEIVELRKYEITEQRLSSAKIEIPDRIHYGFFPLLELPVSGYVMKGVSLFLVERDDLPHNNDNDRFINVYDNHEDDFEDKEEAAAYNEAVMEIFNKVGAGY